MDKRNTGLFVLSSVLAAGERRAYQEGRTQGYKDAQAEMIMDRDERIKELDKKNAHLSWRNTQLEALIDRAIAMWDGPQYKIYMQGVINEMRKAREGK